MKKKKTKWVAGYMTVEATFIMSMVLLLYLFLIRCFLWIYDRCLLEQNLAMSAIRCAHESTDKLEKIWQQEIREWDEEQYLWMELKAPAIKKQGVKVTFTGYRQDELFGEVQIQYVIWQTSPQEWLRMKRRGQKAEEMKGEAKG